MEYDSKIKRVSVTATILFFTFIFLQFTIPVVGNSPPIYIPDDQIFLDCGSSGDLTNTDSRIWIGDIDSKFLNNGESVSSRAETQSSSVADVPYVTARLSLSEFTYSFPVTPGQKFIRLYFYAASYPGFDRSRAIFSVTVGRYTLLRDFNASVNADASGNSDKIFREFCVYVDGNGQNLNITFTPSNRDSYAFVSGIEIISMPINLYYTPPALPNYQGLRGLKFIGQNNKFFQIENYTALEMVYRINIGGNFISPAGDTGMFRTWSQEDLKYLYGLKEDARPLNTTIALDFSMIAAYTAPQDVYRTARSMGPNATLNKSYNITWRYPVDPGFYYMLRLHFCEFEGPISAPGERVFLIYIKDLIAEASADVIQWTGGKGIPYYRDYIVFVSSRKRKKKLDLSVKLEANPEDWRTAWSNVILNGIEIFKLNDSNGNLGGENPDPPPSSSTPPAISVSKDSKNKTMVIVVVAAVSGGVVFGLVFMFIFGLFMLWRGKTYSSAPRSMFSFSKTESSKTHSSAPRSMFSFSTTETSKSHSSTLPFIG